MQQILTEIQTEPFRFSVLEENERQTVIEVSREDYEKDLASGVPEDELLKPGKHIFRRRQKIATREDLRPSNIKVELMVKLDLDVLNHFKARAGEADAAAFQNLINQELRAVMELDQAARGEEEIVARLLQNKTFISALAQELKKVA